ncbi:MAG TPA: aminoacyl-tRNA hydrolase [Arachnia sp.]|nr:aminoacyl-tRNA hydrolase [Arachnia sp.]HQD23006.1 aminoacyl-tRNA hydrolase [Arachnia sp.]
MSEQPFLVVGLGNPGPAYDPTRHNVGFWAVADLADRYGSSFSLASRLRAEVATVTLPPSPSRAASEAVPRVEAIKLILAKPTTYMNESGAAVKAVAAFHKIPADRVIAVHDELDLDPGRLRLKFGGGDNGHNGLKSMRGHLGTGDFYRVRVGIGRPEGRQPAADYVLAKLRPKQLDELRVDAAVAADAVEFLVRHGLVETQNRFNS